MGQCQKWDCVWHGTELSPSAPWCEYCAIHTFYNIPDEPKVRGCEPGEGCDKYRPGKTFEYLDFKVINGKSYPWKRIFRRKPPTAKRLAKFLRQQKHLEHIKAVKEENERKMREKLREEHGMGAFALLLLPKIEESLKEHDTVLDGLYSWDEYVILKNKFPELKLLCIVAEKSLRYDRLTKREIRPLTNEEAEKRDIAEIENLAKGGPIAIADYYILNNKNIESYINDLEEIINK